MRTLRAALASAAPLLLTLVRSRSEPYALYRLAEISVRYARNRCTTSAEITVRMRPFCVYDTRRNGCSFSPVLRSVLEVVNHRSDRRPRQEMSQRDHAKYGVAGSRKFRILRRVERCIGRR
jgi:hypothetical protein